MPSHMHLTRRAASWHRAPGISYLDTGLANLGRALRRECSTSVDGPEIHKVFGVPALTCSCTQYVSNHDVPAHARGRPPPTRADVGTTAAKWSQLGQRSYSADCARTRGAPGTPKREALTKTEAARPRGDAGPRACRGPKDVRGCAGPASCSRGARGGAGHAPHACRLAPPGPTAVSIRVAPSLSLSCWLGGAPRALRDAPRPCQARVRPASATRPAGSGRALA
eukprot:scaffold7377_cov389-Prasinococcus_capsulatus_cf.AAC.29